MRLAVVISRLALVNERGAVDAAAVGAVHRLVRGEVIGEMTTTFTTA